MFDKFVVYESRLAAKVFVNKMRNVVPVVEYVSGDSYASFQEKIEDMLRTFPNNFHSIQLSGVNMCEVAANKLVHEARVNGCKLVIDAEQVDIQDAVERITDTLILQGNTHIFKTYQMYRTDSYDKLISDISIFKKDLNIQLVRGAYLHDDKYSGKLYGNKDDVDTSYNNAINMLLGNLDEVGDVIFATHNMESYNLVKNTTNYKCYHAHLMGFDSKFRDGAICKMVKIPVRPLLKTYPYVIRQFYGGFLKFIYHK